MSSHLTLVRSAHAGEHFVYANNLRFCVREHGHRGHPAVLMIMGLACQLTLWPESLIEDLVARGFHVITFDNRDIGLTDKCHSRKRINTRVAYIKARSRLQSNANYTLHDMADDAAELIKALGLRRAHVVGLSMGGMIAQILAAEHPRLVASLTALMSSSNDPQLPMPDVRLIRLINRSAPARHQQEAVVEHWMTFWQLVQSPDWPVDLVALREKIERNYRRSYCPEGALRQLQAIIATGSLRRLLPHIQCPTLVIHGEKDPFVHPMAGRDVQRLVPGSRFRLMPGMGHDLPPALLPEIVALIAENAGYGA